MAETWRVVDASGHDKSVSLFRTDFGFAWGAGGMFDGYRGATQRAAIRAWAEGEGVDVCEILAPGEPTSAELAARLARTVVAQHAEVRRLTAALATVTAERDGLSAEVDRLTLAGAAPGLITGIVRKILGAVDGEATPTAAQRVVRERDEMAARHDDARADYAAVNEYLGGIVRVWQRASDDERRMADTFVSGLRREIEEARDSGRGAWWEAYRGGNPAPLRTELAVLRRQQGPLLDVHDALVAAARAAGWTGAGATGAELVAWVRRGEREACARVADDEARDSEGNDGAVCAAQSIAALATARRKGAEEMRAAAVAACEGVAARERTAAFVPETSAKWSAGIADGADVCATYVRALPLDGDGGAT